MNVYVVEHDGHWLGGLSVVIAESEEQALALTLPAIKEHGCEGKYMKIKQMIPLDRAACYVLDNGEY